MKLPLVLILSPLVASCTINLHIHEAPKPIVADAGHETSHSGPPEQPMVTGVVRDGDGSGVKARVAVVGMEGGGSNTVGTGADGRFALPQVYSPDFVVHASTEDGRAAVARSHPGDRNFELVVRPGALFVIELQGREKARCAVFADGLRIEDFTIRAGVPEKFVVPPGEHRVRIYEGDTVFEERHFTAKAGTTEAIRMQPHD